MSGVFVKLNRADPLVPPTGSVEKPLVTARPLTALDAYNASIAASMGLNPNRQIKGAQMSKSFSEETQVEPEQGEDQVLDMLKKIQQHLVFLEKKIDSLVTQSQERSFSPKRFSKHPKSFGHSHWSDKGKRGGRPDRGDFNQERRFDKPRRRDEERGNFSRNRGEERGNFSRNRNDERGGGFERKKHFVRRDRGE